MKYHLHSRFQLSYTSIRTDQLLEIRFSQSRDVSHRYSKEEGVMSLEMILDYIKISAIGKLKSIPVLFLYRNS